MNEEVIGAQHIREIDLSEQICRFFVNIIFYTQHLPLLALYPYINVHSLPCICIVDQYVVLT